MAKPLYKEKYPMLFTPMKVTRGKNTLTYKNRIHLGPMMPCTGMDANGLINEEGIDFYVDFAKGGFCNIAWSAPMPPGGAHARALVMDLNHELRSYMDWHRAERLIHAYGANISFEMCHPGPMLDDRIGQAMAASPFFHKGMNHQVKEMDKDDMEKVIEVYVNHAINAKLSGIDSILLHFAHGFVMHSFLSPLMNHRKDEFGGSPENRTRFPRMMIERLREVVGDMIIEVRINGNDHAEGGASADDTAELLKCLEDVIDMAHISCGNRLEALSRAYMHPTHFVPPAHNSYESECIKKSGVKIPIGVVGSIHTAELGERLLQEGKADYVLVARQAVADPQFVNKIREDREADIRPCLRCTHCLDKGRRGALTKELTLDSLGSMNMQCSVNPFYGQGYNKKKFIPATAQIKKKVAVIGGGIAGMQAALTAAERGHDVTLFEKSGKLGGQLFFSDYMWFKVEIKRLVKYMVKQITDIGVKINLNTEATPEMIDQMNFDAVIVAVGAVPITPPIKGVDGANVVQALDVFGNEDKLQKKIAIVGGGTVACEMAIHLKSIDKDYEITIVEMGDFLASTMQLTERIHTLKYLDDYGVQCFTETICTEITDKGIRVKDNTGAERFIEANSIIISTGMKALTELADSFYDTAFDVIQIGDCKKVEDIGHAIDTGWNAGATLSL